MCVCIPSFISVQGAIPLCPTGYGDDNSPNGGVFADFDTWIEHSFFPALLPSFTNTLLSGAVNHVTDDSLTIGPPSYKVTVLPKVELGGGGNTTVLEFYNSVYLNDFFRSLAPQTAYTYTDGLIRNRYANDGLRSFPLHGRIVDNQRISAHDWYQDVRHLRIEVDTTWQSVALDENGRKTRKDDNGPLYIHPQTNPYDAGDVAVVMPQNSDASVQRFLNVLPQHLQSIADNELYIEPLSSDVTVWPSRCTLRNLLTYCADIHSLPEREVLRSLSTFVDRRLGEDQAQKLIDMSESSGSALYADYILREKRTYADVFFDFQAIRLSENPSGEDTPPRDNLLTVEHLLGLLPPMLPRHFSIASSPSTREDIQPQFSPHPDSSFVVELCVAVVQGKTPLGRRFRGLCSNFLANLHHVSGIANGSLYQWQNFPEVRLWIRPGSFGRLPLSINKETWTFDRPLLCIGAGTGIAPLRALLRERFTTLQNACLLPPVANRHQDKGHNDNNDNEDQSSVSIATSTSNILIFGCRKKDADFYYRHEWQEAVDHGSLRLLSAFSQEQAYKVYVQTILRSEGDFLVKHLLENGGALYIAGGAKMSRAVKNEIVEMLGKSLGASEAKMFLKKLQLQGLMSVEAWS